MKHHNKSFWALLGLALLALFSLPVLFILSQNEYYGHQLVQPATDFSLLDVQQQPHSLQSHRGRYTFLYFSYINCNDVCHNQVGVMYNLSQQAKNLKLDFIFVSLDAERDSPQLLDTYFNQLGDNFFSLYHPKKEVINRLTQANKALSQVSALTQGNQELTDLIQGQSSAIMQTSSSVSQVSGNLKDALQSV